MLAIINSKPHVTSSHTILLVNTNAQMYPLVNPDLELSSAAKNKVESHEFSSPIEPRALKSDISIWVKPQTWPKLLITLIPVNLVIKSINPSKAA